MRVPFAGLLLLGLVTLFATAPAHSQASLVVNGVYQVDATGSSVENCNRLRALLAALPPGSIDDVMLVKLEPGTYTCEANTVAIPSYVTVEGSGPRSTLILGNRDSDSIGVVDFDGVFQSSLRGVRVDHYGTGNAGVGVTVKNSIVDLEHVEVVVAQAAYSAGVDARGIATTWARIRYSSVFGATVAIVAAKTTGPSTLVEVVGSQLSSPTVSVTGGAAVRCGATIALGNYRLLDTMCASIP